MTDYGRAAARRLRLDAGGTCSRSSVLCLAALLDTIDVTVVNVAMPAIRDSLHFSESGLSWMVNAYLVPFGGFLLLGGRAGRPAGAPPGAGRRDGGVRAGVARVGAGARRPA